MRARISAESARAELAEDINQSKDRFLASVAHELRTPLSVVMAMTMELSTNRGVHTDEQQAEMLNMAAAETVTIRDTVDDMLVTARLAAGDLAIDRVRTDLPTLANAHLRSLDDGLIELSVDDADLMEIVVDPGRWTHAFRNLVSNAISHASGRVDIAFGQDQRSSWVTVADDGPGIPTDRITQAFEPYRQFSGEPTAPSPVGVGLSVARGLARAMGGDVTYRRVKNWSEFRLTVPNRPAAPVTESSTRAMVPAATT